MSTWLSVENCRFCDSGILDLEFFRIFEIRKLKELSLNLYLETTQIRWLNTTNYVLVINSQRHLIVFFPIPANIDQLSNSSVNLYKRLEKTSCNNVRFYIISYPNSIFYRDLPFQMLGFWKIVFLVAVLYFYPHMVTED